MPKQRQYPLKKYIKAVEILAERKKLRVIHFFGNKNSIRFEVFSGEAIIPMDFWTIHTEHTKKREVWSREDYKKAERNLNGKEEEFNQILETL